MTKIYKIILLSLLLIFSASCKKFIFFGIKVDEDNNPLVQKKMPSSTADLFEAPVITENIPNPDKDGAFSDWATCLVMLKEGHPHGGGKMHGNYVYRNAPWKQEEFAVIHNTSKGIKVKIDQKSTVTFLEQASGKKGPEYFRIIGGGSKLWALCLYFFDKKGNLINNRILTDSDQYQIFFSISDTDTTGKAYDVLDVRHREPAGQPIPAEYFKNKKTFEERRIASPEIFRYTYRDTWEHDDMADGVREFFNIKLLPPLTHRDYNKAHIEDQDYVGLKGHLKFDVFGDYIDPIDNWHLTLKNGLAYTRTSSLLPQFYLAVRVMKCSKGKKVAVPVEREGYENKFKCAEFNEPASRSEWKEIIRFNLPMKVYANTFNSDPTNPDPNEPFYFHLGKEIGLSQDEAFDAFKNIIIHGNAGAGGLGYGAWFL